MNSILGFSTIFTIALPLKNNKSFKQPVIQFFIILGLKKKKKTGKKRLDE